MMRHHGFKTKGGQTAKLRKAWKKPGNLIPGNLSLLLGQRGSYNEICFLNGLLFASLAVAQQNTPWGTPISDQDAQKIADKVAQRQQAHAARVEQIRQNNESARQVGAGIGGFYSTSPYQQFLQEAPWRMVYLVWGGV